MCKICLKRTIDATFLDCLALTFCDVIGELLPEWACLTLQGGTAFLLTSKLADIPVSRVRNRGPTSNQTVNQNCQWFHNATWQENCQCWNQRLCWLWYYNKFSKPPIFYGKGQQYILLLCLYPADIWRQCDVGKTSDSDVGLTLQEGCNGKFSRRRIWSRPNRPKSNLILTSLQRRVPAGYACCHVYSNKSKWSNWRGCKVFLNSSYRPTLASNTYGTGR